MQLDLKNRCSIVKMVRSPLSIGNYMARDRGLPYNPPICGGKKLALQFWQNQKICIIIMITTMYRFMICKVIYMDYLF